MPAQGDRSAGGKILVRLAETLHQDLLRRAASEGISLNRFVVNVLADAVAGVSSTQGPAEEVEAGEEAHELAGLRDAVAALASELHTLALELPQLAHRLDDLEGVWLPEHGTGLVAEDAAGHPELLAALDVRRRQSEARIRARARARDF